MEKPSKYLVTVRQGTPSVLLWLKTQQQGSDPLKLRELKEAPGVLESRP